MIEDRYEDVSLRFDVCMKLAVSEQSSVTAVVRISNKLVDKKIK